MLHPVRWNVSKGILKIGLIQKYLKKLRSRDKLFKAFKKTRLHIDKEKTTAKKQAFFDETQSECVGKPKQLWNNLKFVGKPKKTIVQFSVQLKIRNNIESLCLYYQILLSLTCFTIKILQKKKFLPKLVFEFETSQSLM